MKIKNINLELLCKSDKREFFNLIEKNRNNLRIFLDWIDSTKCEDDLDNFLDRSEKMYQEKKGCNFKIIEKNSIIGIIGFFQNGQSQTIYEIGYWLDNEKRNKGIMSSMIPKIEEICFKQYNAEKVEIWCAQKNVGSNKVAQKNYYKLERQIEKHKKICGVVLDYNIYSKLKEDTGECRNSRPGYFGT